MKKRHARSFSQYIPLLLIILIIAIASFFSTQQSVSPSLQPAPAVLETYQKLPPQAQALYYKQTHQLTRPIPQRMVELDQLTTSCFGPQTILDMPSTAGNLGGQCCGALMNYESYQTQLEVLAAFITEHDNNPLIPKDPYDVPVALAQQLTRFDTDIILSPEQEHIYTQAITLSHHGGPCCCKCWKWYMMSGLGKKLIVDAAFTPEELSELWDISSSCGHEEDTNMIKHYQKR